MNASHAREPLSQGTIIRMPDGFCCQITGPVISEGGGSIIYPVSRVRIDAEGVHRQEMEYALKECFPLSAQHQLCRREDGAIVADDSDEQGADFLALVKKMQLAERDTTSRIYHTAFRMVPTVDSAAEVELSFDEGRSFHIVENAMTVMESLVGKGMTLHAFLADNARGVPALVALRIVQQVLYALREVHDAGYLHLDIQDGNILLQGNLDDGSIQATLIDFGSARPRQEDGYTAPIADRALFSTRGFSAPEMAQNDGALRLGPQADLYSTGYLLLFLLTGTRYDPRSLANARGGHVLTAMRMRHTQCPAHLQGSLQSLLQKALAQEPAERYASAEEMLRDVTVLADALAPKQSDLAAVAYDAFICYKHNERDDHAAATLRHALEHYRIPSEVRKAAGKERFDRVFLDTDELSSCANLGAAIHDALVSAPWLIVVCSPETPQSPWVAQEIDTFLEHHDASHILTVLTAGEPDESFPERLRTATRDDMMFAADARAGTVREMEKTIRRDTVMRVAAPMLGVSYDALKQRRRAWQMRRGMAALGVVLAVALAFLAVVWQDNQRIQESYHQTLQQQSQYLTMAARGSLDENDRLSAIELASAALPAAGESRPLYPDAVRTLAEATLAYSDVSAERDWSTAGLAAKYYMPGKIYAMATSEDEHLLAAFDDKGTLRAWDLQTDELLFETIVPSTGNIRELVLTNDGLVATAGDRQIVCYDIAREELLWSQNLVQMAEGEDSWRNTNSDYSLKLADQKTAIALTFKTAYLVDLHTGAIVTNVPFGMEMKNCEQLEGGWNPLTQQLIVKDGYTMGMGVSLLIDFAAGTATQLKGIGCIDAACFLDDGTVLLANQYSFPDSGYPSDKTVQQEPHEQHVSRIDLQSGAVRWSEAVEAWQPFDCVALIYLGTEVQGYTDHRVGACCFANLCCLYDADTGALLERFELPAPVLRAWPSPSYDADRVLDGILSDGSSFTIVVDLIDDFYGIIGHTLSSPGQYPDLRFESEADAAHLSQCVLIWRSNTIYRYSYKFEDEGGSEVWRSSARRAMNHTYFTSCGSLIIEYGDGADDGPVKTERFSLLDASSGDVLWSRSYDEGEWSLPRVLGDPTGCNHLVLSRTSLSNAMNGQISMIDLADGSEVSYAVIEDSHLDEKEFEELGDSCVLNPLESSHGLQTSDRAIRRVRVRNASTLRDALYLSLTDLLVGKSTLIPFEELGLEDYASTWSLDSWVLGPTGAMIVGTLEDVEDGKGSVKPSVECGIIDVDAGATMRLPLKLRPYIYDYNGNYAGCVVWSQDGRHFVGTTQDEVVVFDASGREVFSVPLEGRELLSVHLIGERMLAVWREDANVYLAEYALASDGKMGLLDGTVEMGLIGSCQLSSTMDDYADAGDFTWLKATGTERDPGDLCLRNSDQNELFLVSIEPFGVCQVVENCVGYDDEARLFITSERDGEEYVYSTYPRYTLDDLLARGEEQVGASAMASVERQAYGLETAK